MGAWTCTRLARTHALADGELSLPAAACARLHVAGCEVCRVELRDLVAIAAVVARAHGRPPRPRGVPRIALVAVAVVVAVAAVAARASARPEPVVVPEPAGPQQHAGPEVHPAWTPAIDATTRRAIARARAGDAHGVLRALAASQRIAAPARCVLGVVGDGAMWAAVSRGADGATVLRRGGWRPVAGFAALLPSDLGGAFAGCAQVDVVAPAGLRGAPRLLPDRIAWRYRLTAGAGRAAIAVRDAREAWLAQRHGTWVRDVVVFE